MQFDELCALVGALRSRVAELEAKEAARAEREAKTVTIEPGLARDWRTLDGKPICAATPMITIEHASGNAEIQAMVEKGVRAGVDAIRKPTVADRNRLS